MTETAILVILLIPLTLAVVIRIYTLKRNDNALKFFRCVILFTVKINIVCEVTDDIRTTPNVLIMTEHQRLCHSDSEIAARTPARQSVSIISEPAWK